MKWRQKASLILGICLLIVGLVLIFNRPIQNLMINHATKTELKAKITKPKKTKETSFDFKQVKSIDSAKTLKNTLNKSQGMIGKIAIPAVALKLPIYYGISDASLYRGAGTMKPDQQMGQGNYALAGHHMNDPKLLFSPIVRSKPGEIIYLTDGKKLYTYKITDKQIISKYAVEWIDDVANQKLITLITCDDKGVDRYAIRGSLVKVQKLTAGLSKKYF